MQQLVPGMRLDRYELIAPLAAGGQGTVWRVRDSSAPDLPRALKLVDLALAGPDGAERVRREAHQLAALRHPSIVSCHGLFEDPDEGVLGLVVTYIEGASLGRLLGDPRLDARHRHLALKHLAKALAYVHQQNIVHRDLKLDNVLVDMRFFAEPNEPAYVKLIDFGIALAPGAGRKLTQDGHVVGTPGYLAPEALDASWGRAERPSVGDVFAFGVLAWRVLLRERVGQAHPSGVEPPATLADYAVAYRRFRAEPELWLSAIGEGEADLAWLRGCLELEPKRRLRHGGEVARLLDALALGAQAQAPAPAPTPTPSPASAEPGRAAPRPPAPAPPSPQSPPPARFPARAPMQQQPHGQRINWFWLGVGGLALSALLALLLLSALLAMNALR